jgi:hypothetical protein
MLLALVWSAGLTVVLPSPAVAAPASCTLFDNPPAQPSAAGGAEDALINAANELAEGGQLDASDRLYRLVLRRDPADGRVATGLEYNRARRLAAQEVVEEAQRLDKARYEDPGSEDEAATAAISVDECFDEALRLDADNAGAQEGPAAPPGTTPAGRAADRWDAFFAGWVDPGVRLILPALAVLAVLLVLARMITSRVVPADALEWAGRRWAWWAGLALLIAVAAFGCAFAVSPSWGAEHDLWWVGALLVVAVLMRIAWLVLHASGLEFPRASPTAMGVAVVVGLIASAAAIAAVATLAGGERGWLWVLAAAVACVGVILVATGRGHALRLLIQVKRGDAADPAGTAYVLGRLQELGSSPPQGLKTPQQVDVSDLPIAALSSLPGGRIAAPLTQLLGLVYASVPWRAIVEDGRADGLLVVTLTRNGSVAQTAVIDAAGFLPEPPDDEKAEPPAAGDGATEEKKVAGAVDRGDLLTAAAAVIITELAERHERLKVGLCGARHWESVAAHVVATKPPASPGGHALKRELLAYAVQADPRNALAQLAYVNELGRGAAAAAPLNGYAERLETLRAAIDSQIAYERKKNVHEREGQGYLPLRLRLAHTLTATRLNVAAATPRPRGLAVMLAAAAEHRALCSLLREAEEAFTDRGRERFRKELAAVAAELGLAVKALFAQDGRVSPDASVASQVEARGLLAEAGEVWDDLLKALDGKVSLDALAATKKTAAKTLTMVDQTVARLIAATENLERRRRETADGREAAVLQAEQSVLVARWATEEAMAALDADARAARQRADSAGGGRPGGSPEVEPGTHAVRPSLLVLFDEACRLTLAGKPDEALVRLEEAAGMQRLRVAALTDPWFEPIRGVAGDGTPGQRRFWDIVGEPESPSSFLNLPPFGTQAEALRAVGLAAAGDIVTATGTLWERLELARMFKVPATTVDRWRDVALLAEEQGLTDRELAMLVAVGVSSPQQLAVRVETPKGTEKLWCELREEARKRQRPLAEDEFTDFPKTVPARGVPAAPVSGGAAAARGDGSGPR